MKWLLFSVCILVCAAGWWFGLVAGVAWSVLFVLIVLIVRNVGRRSEFLRLLAETPIPLILLAPIVAMPIGIGIGLGAFLLGPGF